MSEDNPFPVEEHHGPSHYYGDVVRILFVISAVLLLLSEITPDPFVTAPVALVCAVFLVLAGGLTNPVQTWIHWVNVILSGAGFIFFASITLTRYREQPVFNLDLLILVTLSVLLVVALYLAVRTLRGVLMRGAPEIE